MNDDCIVRKLTADGDGAGDDKRFVSFISHFFKLTRERKPDEVPSHALWLKETLDAAEITLRKQVLLAAMNERQIREYEQLAEEIDKAVKESSERMREAKSDLIIAKGVRRNKEQYELLAGMIQQIPSREESISKLNALKIELQELHEKQRRLETKLTERRNYLHSFSIILSNFNRFLKDEDEKDANEEPMDTFNNDSIGTKKDA